MKKSRNAIAIIGMGCRFPGANNIDEFWKLLCTGKNAIRHFSKQELEDAGIDSLILNHLNYVKARGVLDCLEFYEQKDFAFSNSEFTHLDFQSRIFLKLVTDTLIDAGINPQSCPKKTAVFTGANASPATEKATKIAAQKHSMQPILDLAYTRSLSSLVAYQFDLQGSAISIHTGCSTSLVAIIQACEELLAHKADLAIAGGVSIAYPQAMGYLYEEGGTLSPDGICSPFDTTANGTVLSNGVGVIVLKRLHDALLAGDKIYAAITGKAINNDGRMKTSFLSASIKGQHACIEHAWRDADVELQQIDYIEAHASATLVGDPIEIFALKKTQHGKRYDQKWCGIGSVKSNIGHTTVASGMAAIIKTALMIQHRAIVPTINFKTLNQNIDLDNTPFYIASKYEEFNRHKENYNLGVSNFGFGGTNAHIVLGLA